VVDVINEGRASSVKHVGIVRRGVMNTVRQDYIDGMKKAAKTHQPVELHGFMSTTKGTSHKKKVNMVIEAKGLQGVDVEEISFYGSEREVLFPHKARFLIQKVVPDGDGGYTIYAVEDLTAMGVPAIKLAAA
jgi:hypothetical protein